MATKKWGTVTPPKKRGRGGQVIEESEAQALVDALFKAEGEWIGYPDTFISKGRAVAAAVRYRRAMLDYELIEDIRDITSRVWEEPEGTFNMALRVRAAEE